MGSYARGIQVSSSRNEALPHFKLPLSTEHLNTSDITFHRTNSFHIKPLAILFPRSQRAILFFKMYLKVEFVKTIYRHARTSSEKKSDGLHKKCSIGLWTILLFELLLYCHTAAQCMEQTVLITKNEW